MGLGAAGYLVWYVIHLLQGVASHNWFGRVLCPSCHNPKGDLYLQLESNLARECVDTMDTWYIAHIHTYIHMDTKALLLWGKINKSPAEKKCCKLTKQNICQFAVLEHSDVC